MASIYQYQHETSVSKISITNSPNDKLCLVLIHVYQYRLETSASKKALQIHQMVDSLWHRYMYINTNLRQQSVELALQIHQMANSVWHEYINTDLRHQSVKSITNSPNGKYQLMENYQL